MSMEQGGSTHALAGADNSYEDHDAKGIKLQKGNIGNPYAHVLLSWNVVEKRIRKLVNEDKYLMPAGKEAYVKYREEEDRKALEKAQAKIERDTKVSCKAAIEKAIADKFDGYRLPKEAAEDVIRAFGSERVAYVLANTVMHLNHDGRFSPENKEWAKAIEPYAMIENEDLIVSSHLDDEEMIELSLRVADKQQNKMWQGMALVGCILFFCWNEYGQIL